MIPIGSRVRLIRTSDIGREVPVGCTGTLRAYHNGRGYGWGESQPNRDAGVEWDRKIIGGHELNSANLDVKCKDSHGYWVFTRDIELIDNIQLDLFQ